MSQKISIHATINADIKKVWDYYTQPNHIINWNFADPSWHCPSVTNDMKIGGKYIGRMEARDGSFGFDFEAVYNNIDDGKSFDYTSPDNRNIALSLESKGNHTELNIIFDAENENPIELQKNGWQAILNNFKNYIES